MQVSKVVLFSPRDYEPDEDAVRFRLTYEGELHPSANDNSYTWNKHQIRKIFHPQLKRLWESTAFLQEGADHPIPSQSVQVHPSKEALMFVTLRPFAGRVQRLGAHFARGDYNFVPLVTEDLFLLCEIDVLFLRQDPPGKIISSGDIDGRLKTLFDALRIPRGTEEIQEREGKYVGPTQYERPFYCLLEDDKLISRVTVETDTMLEAVGGGIPSKSDARLVVTVTARPSRVEYANIPFLG